MSRSEIIGSWHNSGFYGHPRSKPRNDFVIEYRHQAKPTPPRIFTKRAQLPSSSHVFSKHDNRHSFLNDALYFEEGLGRKRLENNTNRYDANLLSWISNGREPDSVNAPLSSYMVDYRGVMVDANKLNQRIIRRVKTGCVDVDRIPTTAYRYTHSVDNPYLVQILQPSKDNVSINRIQKPSSHFSRESVASCLSWYVAPEPPPQPSPPTQSWLPAATQTDACHHDWSDIEGHLPVTDDSAKVEKLPAMTTLSTSPLETSSVPSRILVI